MLTLSEDETNFKRRSTSNDTNQYLASNGKKVKSKSHKKSWFYNNVANILDIIGEVLADFECTKTTKKFALKLLLHLFDINPKSVMPFCKK